MAAPKDLTGQRFGRLTVLRLCEEPYISPSGKKTRRWICRCDCGREISVLQNALTGKNGTRSCGCQQKASIRSQAKDMTGQRFGRLTVISQAELPKPEPNGTRLGWRCRCDCGREIVTTRKALLTGKKLSCGCLLSEASAKRVDAAVGHYDGTTISAIKPDRQANKNSQSGVKGVYWSDREQMWIAKITVRRKAITIGRYKTLDEAAAARREAEEKYFAPILENYDSNS